MSFMNKPPSENPNNFKIGESKNGFTIIEVKNRKKWAKKIGRNIEFNDPFYFGSFSVMDKQIYGLYSSDKIYKWISYNTFKCKPITMPKYAKYIYIKKDIIKEKYCGPKKRIKKIMNFKSYISHIFTKEKTYLVYFYWNKTVIYQKPDGYIKENKIYNYRNYYSEIVAEYNPITIFKHKNIVLLKIDKHRYVYIDDFIYEFSTYDEIIEFDKDQSFPAAYGDKYLYLLLNMKYIPLNKIHSHDPYDAFYRDNVGFMSQCNMSAKRIKGVSIVK